MQRMQLKYSKPHCNISLSSSKLWDNIKSCNSFWMYMFLKIFFLSKFPLFLQLFFDSWSFLIDNEAQNSGALSKKAYDRFGPQVNTCGNSDWQVGGYGWICSSMGIENDGFVLIGWLICHRTKKGKFCFLSRQVVKSRHEVK